MSYNQKQALSELRELSQILRVEIPVDGLLTMFTGYSCIDIMKLEKKLGFQDREESLKSLIEGNFGSRAVEIINNNLGL